MATLGLFTIHHSLVLQPFQTVHYQKVKKKMKPVLAILLLVSMFLSFSFLQFTMAEFTTGDAPIPSFCDSKCGVRCANAGVKDRCIRYCGVCCQQCNCVPSGTYGNKSECPCYRDKLNSKGNPKCP